MNIIQHRRLVRNVHLFVAACLALSVSIVFVALVQS